MVFVSSLCVEVNQTQGGYQKDQDLESGRSEKSSREEIGIDRLHEKKQKVRTTTPEQAQFADKTSNLPGPTPAKMLLLSHLEHSKPNDELVGKNPNLSSEHLRFWIGFLGGWAIPCLTHGPEAAAANHGLTFSIIDLVIPVRANESALRVPNTNLAMPCISTKEEESTYCSQGAGIICQSQLKHRDQTTANIAKQSPNLLTQVCICRGSRLNP